MNLEQTLNLYDYQLPDKLIAQAPARPRDSARLLVYDRQNKKTSFDVFANIGKYLPKNSVLVFNQTKVVPARLKVTKESGGKAEILYISHNKTHIKALSNRPLKPGTSISLTGEGRYNKLQFLVEQKKQGIYFLKPNFPISKIKSVLEKFGQTPLPPYIKHSPLNEKQKREQYQTVFARQGLSVAAPTASLHFTKNLINKLKKQGIGVKFVTLNVNLGTFAPLKEEDLASGLLHSETYEINAKTAAELNKLKKTGSIIIPVGTTVIRTLESAAVKGQLKKLRGETRLFIQPGYDFKFVNNLITNFHVPKSSLLMLVSALTGRENILNVYNKAIKQDFRFFSFGDGMLIL